MSESEFAVPVSKQLPVLLAGFAAHLDSRDLAARTRTGYLDRATLYLRWLAAADDHTHALADPDARDVAVVAWLAEADLAPRSVQTSLAALSTFHDWLGLGAPDAPRVTAELYTPRTLDHGEHRRGRRPRPARVRVGRADPRRRRPRTRAGRRRRRRPRPDRLARPHHHYPRVRTILDRRDQRRITGGR
ncbi:site-specific integrase [Nocardia salmonicida]|uniref:site-specific integrase n=1 Tax=Nocardia salmonicida TaxID=53431 RepID=UPI00378DDDD7